MRPMTSGSGADGGHLLGKQSLVPAVQELWNAWEIHLLIMVSLFLQVFLFLFGGMRRHCSKWYLRTVLWLAYLSADSVAVFVLGHLAVRAREPGHELMAFWAPFVLVHLGGQDSITAFSKQDNELWVRHLLNLILQAAVAGYVVAKASWPDTRLMAAMVIMFLCGFFKYGERVLCLLLGDTKFLRLLSHNTLWRELGGSPIFWYLVWQTPKRYEHGPDGTHATKLMRQTKDDNKDNEDLILAEATHALEWMEKGGSTVQRHYIEAARIIQELIVVDAPLNLEQNIADSNVLPGMLKGSLSNKRSRHNAYEHVGSLLEECYGQLYTKELCRGLPFLLCVPFSTTIATSIALALFVAAIDKARDQLHITSSSSSRADVAVTYTLLVGAIALDVSTAATQIFRHFVDLGHCFPRLANCIPQHPAFYTKRQWSQELQQYNIISTAGMFFICQWFDMDVDTKHVTEEHSPLKEFILDTLLLSRTRKEWNIASTRGQLALHKWSVANAQSAEPQTSTLKSLEETIRSSADFPTSVLILHIATDICYHLGGTNNHSGHDDEGPVKKRKQTSKELSNYIMYLVFKCGVMLTTNSKIAHDNARQEIGEVLSQPPKFYNILKPCGELPDCCTFRKKVDQENDKVAAVMRLFEKGKEQQQKDSMGEIKIRQEESEELQNPTTEINNQESEEQQDSTTEIENQESTNVDDDIAAAADHHIRKLRINSQTLMSPVLPRAVAVAQELISIKNEAERWELIAKVWAEMLYYTAPRCGGDFHYEHLSRGGQFVTHVLLLMYYLGPFLPPLDA